MGIARSNLLCCLRTRRRAQAQQHHDGGSGDEANKAFLGATCACCAVRFSHSANARQLKMPTPRRWMRGMNRVFARSPPCGLTAVAADARVVEPRLKTVTAVPAVHVEEEEVDRACDHGFSREQVAAATIQACFRGHLARRAFRALRSLVKMQAFSRGSYVRKQADLAIRCMKVLVRLQVRVRARQPFDMSKSKDQWLTLTSRLTLSDL